MEAITLKDEQIVIDTDKCLGCGLCARKCKAGSLGMLRKKKSRYPKANYLALVRKMYEERGKLPKVIDGVAKELF